jgi:hypothetical protein
VGDGDYGGPPDGLHWPGERIERHLELRDREASHVAFDQ